MEHGAWATRLSKEKAYRKQEKAENLVQTAVIDPIFGARAHYRKDRMSSLGQEASQEKQFTIETKENTEPNNYVRLPPSTTRHGSLNNTKSLVEQYHERRLKGIASASSFDVVMGHGVQ